TGDRRPGPVCRSGQYGMCVSILASMDNELVMADMARSVEHPILHAKGGACLFNKRMEFLPSRRIPGIIDSALSFIVVISFGAAGVGENEIKPIRISAK